MIKNIVFDIGNVILEGTPANCLKYSDIDEESKKVIENVVFKNKKWKELDYGYINFDEYFDLISNNLPNELKSIARELLNNSYKNRRMNKEIMSLMKKLFHNQYKIYILSDNNIDTYNYLKTTELNDFISGWCVSALYHKTKSDSGLYSVLIDEFNLTPDECYFIDDREGNIEKAKEIGMQGFVLDWKANDFDKLISNMIENNIKIDC